MIIYLIRPLSHVIPRWIIVAYHENTPTFITHHSGTPNSSTFPPHNLRIMPTFFSIGARIRPVVVNPPLRHPRRRRLGRRPLVSTAPEYVLAVRALRVPQLAVCPPLMRVRRSVPRYPPVPHQRRQLQSRPRGVLHAHELACRTLRGSGIGWN